MRSLIRVFALLFVPALLDAQTPATSYPGPQLISVGTARVELVPDRARILVAAESRASTSAAAGSETAKKLHAIVDTLRALGIGEQRATTSAIEIRPEFTSGTEGRPPRVAGYVATATLRISIDSIALTGPIIDAVLAKNASAIHSLEFLSSKSDEGRRQALALAVAAARLEADAMARAAGGALGGLIELSAEPKFPVTDFSARSVTLSTMAAMPVAAGLLTESATVTGRWFYLPRP